MPDDKRVATQSGASRVFAGAFIVQFVIIGGLFAYGVFFKVLETELGWSRTLLSAATSIAYFVMGVFAIAAGRATERWGPRAVLVVAGVCYGLGYTLMVGMQAPWQLFVLYGGLIGIGLAAHDVATLSTIARWYPQRRGLMTGFVKSGTALGQMALPLLAAFLITDYGWRTACLVLGIGSGIVLVIAALQMSMPIDSAAAVPQNDQGEGEARSPARVRGASGAPYATVRKTRQFWTLCAAQFLFFPSLMTVPVHIVAHGQDLGMSAARAAAVLSVIGGVSIAGRMLIGGFVDRIGGRNAYLICFSALLASLIGLLFIDSAPWLFGFAVVYGFAHGGFFTVVSPTIAELFGLKAHSTIFGVVLFFGTIGGALGPLLAGAVFDSVGNYGPAFVTLAVLAAVGLLLSTTLRPFVK